MAVWLGSPLGRILASSHRPGSTGLPTPPGAIDVSLSPYNADKTGVSDAAPAINAAITAASVSWTGGPPNVVYMPAGNYRVATDGPVLNSAYNGYHAAIVMKSNVALLGAGDPATRIIRAASGYTDAIGAQRGITNCGFEDFYITQLANGTNGDDGFKFFGLSNSYFLRVRVQHEGGTGFYTPFMLYGSQNVSLEDCTAYGGRNVPGFAVSNDCDGYTPDETDGVTLTNCHGIANNGNGLSYGFCLYNENTGMPRIRNISVIDCDVSDTSGALYSNYGSYLTVTGCTTVNCSGGNKYYFTNNDNLWFPYPSGDVNEWNGVTTDFTNGGSVTERGSL